MAHFGHLVLTHSVCDLYSSFWRNTLYTIHRVCGATSAGLHLQDIFVRITWKYSFETLFKIISMLSDNYLGKFVSHTGHAYLTTGLITDTTILIKSLWLNHVHSFLAFGIISSTCAFLVGGAICLVNSDNERDSSLLNSPRRSFASARRLLRGTSGV